MGNLNLLIPLAFLLFCCTSLDKEQSVLKTELNGTVIKIVDGDTFDLLTTENTTLRIRLHGIDCPEKTQDYYQMAKDELACYILKTSVQLITFGKDRYGRVLSNVFSNNQNINLAMVRGGYAWHYKKYSSDINLAKAENEARATKRGLWQITNPTAPWDYRLN